MLMLLRVKSLCSSSDAHKRGGRTERLTRKASVESSPKNGRAFLGSLLWDYCCRVNVNLQYVGDDNFSMSSTPQ